MSRSATEELNNLAYAAAKSGHATELVELIEQGATDLDWAAIGAATTGHSDVLMMLTGEYIKMCLHEDKYPTVTQLVMNNQSIDDLKKQNDPVIQDELMRLFRDDSGALLELSVRLDNQVRGGKVRYTRDYQDICNKAAMYGYVELIDKYLGEVSDLDQVAYMAARGGHDRILDRAMDEGASDLNFIATGAARTGREDILNKLISLGANNIASLAKIADYEYYIDVAERLRARLTRSSTIPDIKSSVGQAMEYDEPEGVGLTNIPPEVYREYLAPLLNQREKNKAFRFLRGVREAQLDELKKFSFERLLDYLDDHPNSTAAMWLIDSQVEADKEEAFRRMMDFNSTFVLRWFPARTEDILLKALEDKREAIAARAAAKIYVERLKATGNSAEAINYLRALVSRE